MLKTEITGLRNSSGVERKKKKDYILFQNKSLNLANIYDDNKLKQQNNIKAVDISKHLELLKYDLKYQNGKVQLKGEQRMPN